MSILGDIGEKVGLELKTLKMILAGNITVYVDKGDGDNLKSGLYESEAVQTINRALEVGSYASIVTIKLIGDNLATYNIDSDLVISNKTVIIESLDPVASKSTFTFNKSVNNINKFQVINSGRLVIDNVDIEHPGIVDNTTLDSVPFINSVLYAKNGKVELKNSNFSVEGSSIGVLACADGGTLVFDTVDSGASGSSSYIFGLENTKSWVTQHSVTLGANVEEFTPSSLDLIL